MSFMDTIIDSLRSGSIYALVALAFALGFNVCGIMNFVNGEIFVISIYIISLLCFVNIPFWLAVIISILICAAFNVVIERYIYKPLLKRPKINALVVSIGLAFLIQNIFVLFLSSDPFAVPNVVSGELKIGVFEIEYTAIISILVAIFTMVILYEILKRTKFGRMIRAVSENSEATALMGINVDKIISVVFAICALLIVFGGLLFCLSFPIADPYTGTMIALRSLAGSIIGGLGLVSGSIPACIPGAVFGGFLIGLIETFVKSYISIQLADVVIFIFLAVFLLINHKRYK